MNELSVLRHADFGCVRTVMKDDEPWFVAKDVCDVLGLDNVTKALVPLDVDEKHGFTISNAVGKNQEVRCVSESGLYALIFQSRKPQARAFRRWITSEVLPSLRKYGYYIAPGAELTDAEERELRRAMMDGIRRFISRRDLRAVARRTGFSEFCIHMCAAGRYDNSLVIELLQERALKNRAAWVDPYSPARMREVIERLRIDE